eukprot:TRINITY_DN8215_c0_g1_i1.p1 TRINITY_DN8215_c0_g1~~TRINITY_DN8215_c0_g1_i1.p1  ORF type:complete len:291 (+),score=57.41 TRINITY_DN8215_c0_g1_i1:281-1153(+)
MEIVFDQRTFRYRDNPLYKPGSTAKKYLMENSYDGKSFSKTFNTETEIEVYLMKRYPVLSLECRMKSVESRLGDHDIRVVQLETEVVELREEISSLKQITGYTNEELSELKEKFRCRVIEVDNRFEDYDNDMLTLKERIQCLEDHIAYLKSGRCKVDSSTEDSQGNRIPGTIEYKENLLTAMKNDDLEEVDENYDHGSSSSQSDEDIKLSNLSVQKFIDIGLKMRVQSYPIVHSLERHNINWDIRQQSPNNWIILQTVNDKTDTISFSSKDRDTVYGAIDTLWKRLTELW